ncbi:hypothetical protein C8J56DRAFT_742584, partial [Mycena floridula]
LFHARRRATSQRASLSGVKLFAYHFTDPSANVPASIVPPGSAPGSLGGKSVLGSILTKDLNVRLVELYYMMNQVPNLTLSAVMTDYWISFISSLDPNDGLGTKR